MKLSKLLLEIGEITNAYSYALHTRPDNKHPHPSVIYEFKTEANLKYRVEFEMIKNNTWDRFFTANNSYRETNKGDVYKIIATITKITLEFLQFYKPETVILTHKTSSKEVGRGIEDGEENARAKLNRIFLTKNMIPEYTIEAHGHVTLIKRVAQSS